MKLKAIVFGLLLIAGCLSAQTKGAIVTGKVMDADGDPLQTAAVELLSEYWQGGKKERVANPRQMASTDDRGQYRIANIPPGKYYLLVTYRSMAFESGLLQANGKPDIRPWPTFYPQAGKLSDATPLELTAAQQMTGINIVMRSGPTYHIRGNYTGPLDPSTVQRIQADIADADGLVHVPSAGSAIRKDGTFDIVGLSPGQYVLQPRVGVHIVGCRT